MNCSKMFILILLALLVKLYTTEVQKSCRCKLNKVSCVINNTPSDEMRNYIKSLNIQDEKVFHILKEQYFQVHPGRKKMNVEEEKLEKCNTYIILKATGNTRKHHSILKCYKWHKLSPSPAMTLNMTVCDPESPHRIPLRLPTLRNKPIFEKRRHNPYTMLGIIVVCGLGPLLLVFFTALVVMCFNERTHGEATNEEIPVDNLPNRRWISTSPLG